MAWFEPSPPGASVHWTAGMRSRPLPTSTWPRRLPTSWMDPYAHTGVLVSSATL
jgi:hypothetical protein